MKRTSAVLLAGVVLAGCGGASSPRSTDERTTPSSEAGAPAAPTVTLPSGPAMKPTDIGFVSQLEREITLDTDCVEQPSALVPAAGDVGGSVHLATDILTGQPAVVVSEPAVDERPAAVLAGVAASRSAKVVVAVVDRRGDDDVTVSSYAGASWKLEHSGPDIDYPAVSPGGVNYAFVQAGLLYLGQPGGSPAPVALPGKGLRASNVSFADDQHLLAGVAQPVEGVDPEFAGLVELWSYDLDRGSWVRLATGDADEDVWSIARSPVPAGDGRILFLMATGRGSGNRDSLRTELWSTELRAAEPTLLREVPIDALLVGVGVDGSITWNIPDRSGQWHLLQERADSSVVNLGCGRSSFAPPLNGDPDL